MRNKIEDALVKEKQKVIRDYLIDQFKGFDVTNTPRPPLSHIFIVTKSSEEQYRLKVAWPYISDSSNTPARLKWLLVVHDVAQNER